MSRPARPGVNHLFQADYTDIELRTLAEVLQGGPDISVDMEAPAKEVARLLDLADIAPRWLRRTCITALWERALEAIDKDVQDLLAGQYPNVEVVYVEDGLGLWRRAVRMKVLTP